jgi:hypothetical protein
MERLTRRAVGLGFAVIVAALAVAVPVASAKLPEFGKCKATSSGKGGRYADAGCITKAHRQHGELQGGYEWAPLEESFSVRPLELQTPMAFETASGARVECSTGFPFNSESLTGSKGAQTPLWIFESCQSEGQECHSSVSIEEGEISDESEWLEEAEEGGPAPGWSGTLGFVSKGATPVVGMAYKIKNDERAFPPISCRGAVGTIWVGGGPKGNNTFIQTIGPVNQMVTSFTESLSESAPGIASPAKLQGHQAATLQAFRDNKWEPMAMVGTWQGALEEGEVALEIKATP